jgi:hypothetical protein
MPNIGMFKCNISGFIEGEPSSHTLAGPPENIIALGGASMISLSEILKGFISE